ncbi:hypothetical protein B0H15DRAFT_445112 [Mycena belliarum]|uniref:BTB domain-containing protein n=1 Tax=Mycena belliarum TaxID=1033014 RepID=A0AAD6U1M0_9AGAR|nr:hypothetical protein B0H15DRAFT_445112 [Mycena belliae]
MSTSPPAKRQRPDVEIIRSAIWHPDGSVVLQAGNTQFRVHWSVLALHSSFFRDMQGLPQPPDQPSVEGCPVVELTDVAEDVTHVLRALYNPLFFARKAISLPIIASHVRLGRKYDFTAILHSVLERLTDENPTSLDAYEALKRGNGSYSATRVLNSRGIYVDTVTLARENNILSVLPCAYYRVLISSSPTQIFDGVDRGDGTVATLSAIDQRRCSAGRAAILRAQWDTGNTFGWIQETIPAEETGCIDVIACRRKKASFFHRHVVKGSFLAFSSHIEHLKLCRVCSLDGETKLTEGRKKMWELLPTFFELPPWSELKDDL